MEQGSYSTALYFPFKFVFYNNTENFFQQMYLSNYIFISTVLSLMYLYFL